MTHPEITTVELPSHGATITISRTLRPAGIVAYQVTGPRLRSIVVVEPYVRDDQPVPDRYAVVLGDGSPIEQLRTGLAVVHGATLHGSAGPVDLTDPHWTTLLRLGWVGPAATSRPVTDTARQYLTEALGAVAGRHLLLDQRELMLAAARATAMARLRRCVHGMLPAGRLIHEVREDLTAAYALAAQLQALSPLTLTAPGSRCRGWHPCLNPDAYLTADDDGDWLTCPDCGRVTTMVSGSDRLGSLLAAYMDHTCG